MVLIVVSFIDNVIVEMEIEGGHNKIVGKREKNKRKKNRRKKKENQRKKRKWK